MNIWWYRLAIVAIGFGVAHVASLFVIGDSNQIREPLALTCQLVVGPCSWIGGFSAALAAVWCNQRRGYKIHPAIAALAALLVHANATMWILWPCLTKVG